MKIPGDAVNHPLECSVSNYKSANKQKKDLLSVSWQINFLKPESPAPKKRKAKRKKTTRKKKKQQQQQQFSHKDHNNNL